MTFAETITKTVAAPVKFNLITWFVRLDASFREANQLKNTKARNLKDMGITRKQADTAFYRQFAETRH
ncbi:MAG: hypothetical protein JKY41_02945 [Rhodobacteraceae bacterium]|nr:hypothetical protein [Paracoccaceae bacterium]